MDLQGSDWYEVLIEIDLCAGYDCSVACNGNVQIVLTGIFSDPNTHCRPVSSCVNYKVGGWLHYFRDHWSCGILPPVSLWNTNACNTDPGTVLLFPDLAQGCCLLLMEDGYEKAWPLLQDMWAIQSQ